MAEKMPPLSPDPVVGGLVLRRILGGIPNTALQALRAQGMPHHGEGSRLRYKLDEVIPWYIKHLGEGAKALAISKDQAVLRKLTAEAMLREVELAKERGQLIAIADAEAELSSHLSVIRRTLLALPSRIAPYLVGLTSEALARKAMKRAITDLMDAIAKGIEAGKTTSIEEDGEEG